MFVYTLHIMAVAVVNSYRAASLLFLYLFKILTIILFKYLPNIIIYFFYIGVTFYFALRYKVI